jgi:hypothetical protein
VRERGEKKKLAKQQYKSCKNTHEKCLDADDDDGAFNALSSINIRIIIIFCFKEREREVREEIPSR